jgi:hypothetical protein
MKTYQLTDGDRLVFSVNQKKWEAVVFEKKDFADIAAATAQEIAKVINNSDEIRAEVDEQENLVIATVEEAGNTTLEIDGIDTSPGLGLTSGPAASGSGLRIAQLVTPQTEPFALAAGSELTLVVDGHRRRIVFNAGFKPLKATADEIAKIVNAKKKKIAYALRNGAIMLRSNRIGAGSELVALPAADAQKDAAAVLGLTGAAAEDAPYPSSPARILCGSTAQGLQAVNLTASPIELHTQEGSVVIPARRSVPLTINDTANTQLQNLIDKGVIKLSPGTV